MALEDIFRALEHQAERDVADVLAEARARAAGIVSEAEIEAARVRERYSTEAENTGRARSMQGLNTARLEARRKLAGVKQQAVERAFDAARAELAKVRDSSGYPALFERLLDQALAGVEGEFDVLVDPRDAALAQAVIEKRSLQGRVKPDLSSSGGMVISMAGGRILRRNTREDRFEKLASMSQSDVSEILFS